MTAVVAFVAPYLDLDFWHKIYCLSYLIKYNFTNQRF
jgi:hypothetical protein